MYIPLTGVLAFLLLTLFFFSNKSVKMDNLVSSVFECGFSPYFFSHFSFSMHYFVIGLIFLFLDLELCYLMPYFNNCLEDFKLSSFMGLFILILLVGLMEEWKYQMLEWKF